MKRSFHTLARWLPTALVATGLLLPASGLFGQEDLAPPDDVELEGADVLTRGPVHESFSDAISYDPVPGMIVPKAPPDPIEEIPPEVRPDGDNVGWINGYWAWDEDRDDFIWLSGVWRNFPPTMRWVDGYWANVSLDDGSEGWQRISGFWAPTKGAELSYVEAPPASLERGPSSPAPGADYFWAPGVWQYNNVTYNWRPGYWNAFRPGWVWVPSRYVWTPRGYLFLGGYWDYPLVARGHLYAPIYFSRPIYRQPRFVYTPRIMIGGPGLAINLFVRPNAGYFFGDFYGPQYARRNYYSFVDFHVHHRGYVPNFAYNQVHFARSGVNYEQRMRGWQNYYTKHEDFRPPHTLHAQREFLAKHDRDEHVTHAAMGTSLAELKSGKIRLPDSSPAIVKVNDTERRAAARQASDLSKLGSERVKSETAFKATPGKPFGDKPGERPAAGAAVRAEHKGILKLPDTPKIATGGAAPPSLEKKFGTADIDRATRLRPADGTGNPLGEGRGRGAAGSDTAGSDAGGRTLPKRGEGDLPRDTVGTPRIKTPPGDSPKTGDPLKLGPKTGGTTPPTPGFDPPKRGDLPKRVDPPKGETFVPTPKSTIPPTPKVDLPKRVDPPKRETFVPTPKVDLPKRVDPPKRETFVPTPKVDLPKRVDPPKRETFVPTPKVDLPKRVDPPKRETFVPTPKVDLPKRVDPPKRETFVPTPKADLPKRVDPPKRETFTPTPKTSIPSTPKFDAPKSKGPDDKPGKDRKKY